MKFRRAYYIKLGRGGCWEADSLSNALLRFGWSGQSVDDINRGRWERIRQQLQAEHDGKPQVATNDFNRLRDIALSSDEDIWITFHKSKLWWARIAEQTVFQDQLSKFRRIEGSWSDASLTGRRLIAVELPGKIAQLQAFRGTVCKVGDEGVLRRLLDGAPSPIASAIASGRDQLCDAMVAAIEQLHWKDYETLVDLVFRAAGWIRVSVLGQQTKGYDLELREPVTQDRYVVQVKSTANRADVEETIAQFSSTDYRRVFFVVHTPVGDLRAGPGLPKHLDLVYPRRLAELALDAGLARWLQDKAA